MDEEKELVNRYYIKNKEKIKEHYKNNREECLEKSKDYYLKNRDKILKRQEIYRLKNKNTISEYYKKNKEKLREYNKQWAKNNSERMREYYKQYREDNSERIKKIQRKYCKNNKKKINEYINEWTKNKRKTDLKYNINCRISAAILESLRGNKAGRHWEDLVGYTLADLIKRLKKTIPEGYCWNDCIKEKLEIDHIIPKSVFNYTKPDHADFKNCWALSNLRLLPAKDNRIKYNKLFKPFQPALQI